MQTVVTAGDQQEDGNDGVDHRAVEIADAGIVSRETADGDGGETVPDRIERRHTGKPERQCAGDRE